MLQSRVDFRADSVQCTVTRSANVLSRHEVPFPQTRGFSDYLKHPHAVPVLPVPPVVRKRFAYPRLAAFVSPGRLPLLAINGPTVSGTQ
jgi:hypothetical protein